MQLCLELARKYECGGLLARCEDFLCSESFQLDTEVSGGEPAGMWQQIV